MSTSQRLLPSQAFILQQLNAAIRPVVSAAGQGIEKSLDFLVAHAPQFRPVPKNEKSHNLHLTGKKLQPQRAEEVDMLARLSNKAPTLTVRDISIHKQQNRYGQPQVYALQHGVAVDHGDKVEYHHQPQSFLNALSVSPIGRQYGRDMQMIMHDVIGNRFQQGIELEGAPAAKHAANQALQIENLRHHATQANQQSQHRVVDHSQGIRPPQAIEQAFSTQRPQNTLVETHQPIFTAKPQLGAEPQKQHPLTMRPKPTPAKAKPKQHSMLDAMLGKKPQQNPADENEQDNTYEPTRPPGLF